MIPWKGPKKAKNILIPKNPFEVYRGLGRKKSLLTVIPVI